MSTSTPKKTFWAAWTKPPQGFIKINSDGSKTHHQASGGHVICNWIGHLIQARAFNLGAPSILAAEAIVIRNGLRVVVEARFNNIFIEGDNKILSKLCKDISNLHGKSKFLETSIIIRRLVTMSSFQYF